MEFCVFCLAFLDIWLCGQQSNVIETLKAILGLSVFFTECGFVCVVLPEASGGAMVMGWIDSVGCHSDETMLNLNQSLPFSLCLPYPLAFFPPIATPHPG